MTVSPAPTRSRHRHSKSSSTIQTVTLSVPLKPPQPRFQPPTHQNQTSPSHRNNSNSSPIPRPENGSSKKKRRSRKPKENIKVSPTRLNASLSDSAIPHTTSPIGPEQMTPTKPTASPGKAYAGPTFHHSPAPSALPVPKFFSKSVPTRSRNEGLQAMLEEDDRTDEPLESPVLNGSPLEKLFRVDRKEKALKNRQFSDSSDCDSTSDSTGRDIFGMDTDSPIRAVFNTSRRTHVRSNTATESIFSMDSFSMPSSPAPPISPFNDDPERRAKSDALKKFLLHDSGVFFPNPTPRTTATVVQSQTMPNIQGSPVPQRHQGRRGNSLSTPPPKDSQYCTNHRPPLIKNFSPQRASIFEIRTDTVPCKTDPDDFTDMENSLRKILKLDPRPVFD